MSASDRITLEKDAELQMMRTRKRGERDFFKKLENGELKEDGPKEPKLLVGRLKMNGEDDYVRNRPQVKRFTPPRKLNSDEESESGSDYSDSEYSSDYSDSDDYSSDFEGNNEDKEYLRAV